MSENVCPGCAGAGYYTLAVPVGHPDFGKLLPCACLIRRREGFAQRAQAERRQVLLAELSRTLGRLASARFNTFDLERPLIDLVWGGETFAVDTQRHILAQALDDAQRYANQPQGWLYLCGPCGAGKSHLAAAIANHVATHGLGAAYASTPALVRFVRRGIASGAADERLDAPMEVELLVLDDLGAERMTAWADEQLQWAISYLGSREPAGLGCGDRQALVDRSQRCLVGAGTGTADYSIGLPRAAQALDC